MKYSIKKDYGNIESPNAVAIVPVKDFYLSEKYFVNNISVYPPNSVNVEELNEYKFDFSFEEFKRDFFNCALVVFPLEHIRDNIIGTLMPEKKNKTLSQVLDKADDIISIFRYIYCNFDMTSNLPQHAGYIKGIISGMLIYYPKYGNSDFIFEKHKVVTTTIGNGMAVDVKYDKDIINKYAAIFCDDCGEVGNIIKHAFRLYSNIVYSANNTNKFILAMSLMEYLASPFKYIKMQDVKTRILPFSSSFKKEYHLLCNRFMSLTGKKVDGVEVGLRTNIVHNGKTIDELVNDKHEVDLILRELQSYICNVINEIICMYKNNWSDVDVEVTRRLKEIENDRNEFFEIKKTMDVLIFIDFRFLNNSIKEIYQLYPQYIDKKINISSLLYLIAKQVDINRSGYTIPVQIVYDYDEKIFNCDNSLRVSMLENKGFDCNVGQFDIYASKANIEYDAYMENLLTHYFYEMNFNINPNSKFSKIILISDRCKIRKEFFEIAEKSCKKLYIGRLDNKRTTIYPECTWFDIQVLYMKLLGIELWEECQEDFIYNLPKGKDD